MEQNRRPTIQELQLIELLVQKSSIIQPPNWKNDLLVSPMDDGGMGGLLLHPEGKIVNRLFGKRVAEFQFADIDGVEIIASLNLDDKGELLELDMWKTDFSPLMRMPDLG